MKKVGLVATLATLAGMLAASAPASADFHAYRDANYLGTHWQWSGPTNQVFYVGGSVNDEITAFKNWRSGSTYFTKNYPLYPGDPLYLCQRANSYAANLKNYRWANSTSVNDSISGLQLSTGNPC